MDYIYKYIRGADYYTVFTGEFDYNLNFSRAMIEHNSRTLDIGFRCIWKTNKLMKRNNENDSETIKRDNGHTNDTIAQPNNNRD